MKKYDTEQKQPSVVVGTNLQKTRIVIDPKTGQTIRKVEPVQSKDTKDNESL